MFSNGIPTLDWYNSLRSRFSDLRLRVAQNMPSDRAKASSQDKVKKVNDKHDLHDRPEKIFNCDESGFQPDQGSLKNTNECKSWLNC